MLMVIGLYNVGISKKEKYLTKVMDYVRSCQQLEPKGNCHIYRPSITLER